jgi:hypothetical protein
MRYNIKIIFVDTLLSIKRHKSTFLGASIELDIIAIHAQIPPHLMAWCLDDTFSSQFVRQDPSFSVFLSQNTESKHVEYHWEGSETACEMWIVENKGSGGLLYNGKPTPDFWLLLRGAEDMGGTEEWLKGIKTITSVQMAYDFPAEKHSKLTWITALSRL